MPLDCKIAIGSVAANTSAAATAAGGAPQRRTSAATAQRQPANAPHCTRLASRSPPQISCRCRRQNSANGLKTTCRRLWVGKCATEAFCIQ